MTLKDIAALSDVSISTVSRIINSPDDCFASRAVRERVWENIKKTGYVPNQHARSLKCGKTSHKEKNGSLVCLLGREHTTEENPFFAQLVRSIEQQALESGYPVRFVYTLSDLLAGKLQENTEQSKPNGVVILGKPDVEKMNLVLQSYPNVIYVGRNPLPTACDQVICNGYEATKMALDYLFSCGHRKISYLGETEDEIRYLAYLKTMAAHSLPIEPDFICTCAQNTAGGYQGAGKLLKSDPLPSAVFCASDAVAIAAMKRFRETRIKIPTQISIIGMDNISLSGYVSPMLTTVGMPIVELGQIAVRTLLDRIHKQHRLPMKIFLPNKLIVRESVAVLSKPAATP